MIQLSGLFRDPKKFWFVQRFHDCEEPPHSLAPDSSKSIGYSEIEYSAFSSELLPQDSLSSIHWDSMK